MTNSTSTTKARAKMTIRVYSVNQAGVASAPRAVVSVPHGYEPDPEMKLMNTQLPPCACPIHRQAGVR
ncbi:hypothetical protein [Streptomyces sp. 1222.5]|uniref:hypothetical protein n=1 Tax=Streptomyces sp. 1222.5 TaxID=1881026 RepID=UPI003EBA2824